LNAGDGDGFVAAVDPEAGNPLGGKAAPLRRLAALGFPVWPGLVLLPEAFRRCREPGEPWPRRLSASLLADLRGELSRLAPAGTTLAVRSSCGEEDGRSRSFAGQFATELHVPPEALEAAILRVWASAFAAGPEGYARQMGASRGGPPAVLIQPMLPARAAGVAFAADPVSGQRGVTLIQAIEGLAADLVAGRAEGECHRVDREGRLLERRLARPGPPLLSDATVVELARLVRQVSRRLGAPQDVEWALEDGPEAGGSGRLWLLQARPITTLRQLSDPDGAPGLWDNSNIVESYGGVTTPLTFSFARRAYTEVYAQFCRFMGVDAATVLRHRAVFATMIGFHRGRLYYNLQSWYRVLSLLPGYDLNAGFLEQMLGVRQRLSPERRRQLRLEPPSHPLRDLLRLAGTGTALVVNALSLERRRRAFRRRLDRVLLGPAALAALGDARPDELVAHYRRIESELLSRWDAPLINDFYAMVAYGLLGGLLRRWDLDPEGGRLNAWITDLGAVISAEPPRRIQAMARHLESRPDLVALLGSGSAVAIQRALETLPALQAELESYLDDFGDRCLEELKLETLTLRDDPLPLLRSLGAAARSGPAIGPSSRDDGAGGAALPRPGPLRALLLGWLRRRLRQLVTQRENLRFERTRVFGQARRLLLELGQRYAALGWLDRPGDAVFLEVEELLAMVEGNGSTGDLRGLVAVRRAEWRRHRASPPLPRRFETRGLPLLSLEALTDEQDPPTTPAEEAADDHWQGLGCSAGVVRGPVARVDDPRTWLEAGPSAKAERPILVAPATDPGWVLLFPHAAGLLVERGSVLSHVAIVAREMGLPMVTELAGISGAVADGDRLELDGRSGRVRRLPPEGRDR
jgi:pyruvate,water dikinase